MSSPRDPSASKVTASTADQIISRPSNLINLKSQLQRSQRNSPHQQNNQSALSAYVQPRTRQQKQTRNVSIYNPEPVLQRQQQQVTAIVNKIKIKNKPTVAQAEYTIENTTELPTVTPQRSFQPTLQEQSEVQRSIERRSIKKALNKNGLDQGLNQLQMFLNDETISTNLKNNQKSKNFAAPQLRANTQSPQLIQQMVSNQLSLRESPMQPTQHWKHKVAPIMVLNNLKFPSDARSKNQSPQQMVSPLTVLPEQLPPKHAKLKSISSAQKPLTQGIQGAPKMSREGSREYAHKISNVVTKFSFATKGGISISNPYKQNQDAYLTNPHILQKRHCHFFSVCDGHGHFGHDVSGLLKHKLPSYVENQLKQGLQSIGEHYPTLEQMTVLLTRAFELSNKDVYSMINDVRFSGSTCVSVLTYGSKLFVANVGDSRAIIIKANPDGSCVGLPLSRDHKPDDPEESKVILAGGGRIDSYRDQLGNQIGPMRVWLKNEDTPGLAMSRSFGDAMACRAGVHAVPEVKSFDLVPDDKIIVVASDGVWEFLENQQVANVVFPFLTSKNAEGAAEALVRAAYKRWRSEESNIDDITCVIVFLDVK